jgi:predicted NBD/HSP70 family sugar kinase
VSLAGATQDEVRRHNLAALVRFLHDHGSSSRSELVSHTGLNRSTVGGLIADLEAVGLVRETEPVGRGVGRPSYGVEPVQERAYVLAIDLRVDRSIVALVGFGGAVLARREHRHKRGQERRIVAQLAEACRAVLAEAPEGALGVGIGVGVPGLVRHADGLVRFAPNLGWTDVPLGELLATELGTGWPVQVGNDSDLGAIAERVRGAARGCSHVIYLSGQIGVGGGVIVDGRLLVGAGGYGGEVGHMQVNPKGRPCRCGSVGCWETEIGEAALRTAAGAAERSSAADIVAAAAAGDKAAAKAVRSAGRWLGVGVANLVNIFNPDVVVFGGALRDVLPATREAVLDRLATALPASAEHVVLALPALGDDSTLLGAAEVAFEPLLSDPLGTLAAAEPSSRVLAGR